MKRITRRMTKAAAEAAAASSSVPAPPPPPPTQAQQQQRPPASVQAGQQIRQQQQQQRYQPDLHPTVTLASVNPDLLTEENLSCLICFKILIEPATLPCKHSCCHDCIFEYFQTLSYWRCPCLWRFLSWERMFGEGNWKIPKDEVLWGVVKMKFPDLVEKRLKELALEGKGPSATTTVTAAEPEPEFEDDDDDYVPSPSILDPNFSNYD